MSTSYSSDEGLTPEQIAYKNKLATAAESGLGAIMQASFGLRLAEWFFAMLAFSCMGSATDLNEKEVTLASFEEDHVNYETGTGAPAGYQPLSDYSGHFDFSGYRFLVATAVFVWFYALLSMIMAIHPKGDDSHCLIVLPNRFLKLYIKYKGFFEFTVDSILLFFAFCSIMASAVDVEQSVLFESEDETIAFTLGSFYDTMHARGYKLKTDPTGRIRAGVAFTFFCFFLLTYSVWHSYRQWKETSSGEARGTQETSSPRKGSAEEEEMKAV